MPERDGWRRYIPSKKVVAGVFGLGALATFALVGVAYAMTPVPAAGTADAQEEAAIIYYADKKEMARLGTTRVSIPIDQVPEQVQYSVLAAENRDFYTDPGVSVSGLARAVWNNVSGGETQGGSTITQQLAKKYYLTDERTLTRKSKELFIAIKLEQQKDKKEILELYLNTIYFGRGAKGIEAAARAYFCKVPTKRGVCPRNQVKNAKNLTPDEGALLAAMIQLPSQYEPYDDKDGATLARYRYVLDGMVEMGKLDAATAGKYKQAFPRTLMKPQQSNLYGGQRGYMIKAAMNELERKGISEETVLKQSLRVYTTFDSQLMLAAEKAVNNTIPEITKNKRNKRIQTGLVSVQPGTGRIRAMYGGKDFLKDQVDNVFSEKIQPGSSFKPYVLAAALKNDIGLKSLVEGGSPRWFANNGDISRNPLPGGNGYRVQNNANEQYGVIDLVKATQNSVNTAYVQLGLRTGLGDVTETAEEAGLPKEVFKPYGEVAGLSLGIAEVHPVDQAAGFATFANQGEYVEPHVIDKVLQKDRTPFRNLEVEKHTAFSAAVAADATYAMEQVVRSGTGRFASLPDRPVAGKTGTTEKNKAAWFVGFTPQMSTAVAIFDSKGKPMILNGTPVFGGTSSAKIFRAFMEPAMRGKPVEKFPTPQYTGSKKAFATPKPTPTPSRDPNQPCRPGDPGFPFCPPNGQPTPGPTRPGCPVFDPNCNPTGQPSSPPPRVCEWPDPPPFCPPKDGDQPQTQSQHMVPATEPE
jgi:membrane peptidoglycan carboxypeptidase